MSRSAFPRSLFIPPLGTVVELAQDWDFKLWGERRNAKMLVQLGLVSAANNTWAIPVHKYATTPAPVSLPAGTCLRIERIYIRQGSSGFDSVTFTVVETPDKRFLNNKAKLVKARFWVKLEDANTIEVASVNP